MLFDAQCNLVLCDLGYVVRSALDGACDMLGLIVAGDVRTQACQGSERGSKGGQLPPVCMLWPYNSLS